jgi:hypothetical protein
MGKSVIHTDLATIYRTLISAGFVVINFSRKPTYIAFHAYRSDEFGVKTKYLIAFAGPNKFSPTDLSALHKSAKYRSESLVIVGETEALPVEGAPVIPPDIFLQRLGGAVSSYLPLEPFYPKHLEILGGNKLPKGLTGKADELFEQYVYVGLLFLLQQRVVRYGQDRLFEALPDGITLGGNILLLYDCKAAEDGYDVNSSSMRQFADYVDTFHNRYQNYVGRINSFLVISGSFQRPDTLDDRSKELISTCGVPLSFLTAKDMGSIIKSLVENPVFRQTINWKRVFSIGLVNPKAITKDLKRRKKDGIISR